MCHHYCQASRPRAADYGVQRDRLQLEFPEGGFYPLSRVPIVRFDPAGERELIAAEWGLLPFWWKPSGAATSRKAFQRRCFNARSETAAEKPAYREAFKHRRCLIPATEFYERGHGFRFADARPFAFAGLWESWSAGDGETIESCTLLTTEPNALIRSVGHHRMPVLLSDERAYAAWLDLAEVSTAPTPADAMTLRPPST
ncbi:MAG: SOS response-associated peptidase [Pirellulales bacterium]|nr:SOS response-associated peptidase [Pirellulales bacterium]